MNLAPAFRCQVLVVGSGPGGADLARRLARAQVEVLLVDRLPDLSQAAFSSAALPLAAIERLELPAQVVASRWSQWQLLGPGEQRRGWASDRPLGVVLEFGALRQWLADEARGWGADLLLGATAQGCQPVAAGMCTRLRLPGGGRTEVISDWVVDATGQERGLIGDPAPGRDPLVEGLGVEWLIELPPERWQPWADRLSFCLGSDWVPQGYGWVFPMQPGQLKVGVCRLMDPASPQPALGPLLARLISRLGLGDHRVLDRHGGLIRSTIGRRESHRRGRLMALGDAVSTANLLGGEGIRHAMTSSQVLAPLLAEALRHPTRADHLMDLYPKRLRRALGWRWGLSGRLARRTWLGLRNSQADRRLDGLLRGLERKNRAEDLSALLFDYRFERYGLRALPDLLGWR
ncbi:NAD(P)/FAD-dependent oxidoreductase [Cyanobium sp. ATX 6F1]|uniref:NAD(P)/FAD-dependent oxidoreductase n=1 Tax=Cyanobium sp. ATX 6F1 TaxID=2823702 RepID=UPI0020CB8B2F|nr:NAD(P)/FAD-dependent oxidoreductase [Cyanobium sp. ATX 6F1]